MDEGISLAESDVAADESEANFGLNHFLSVMFRLLSLSAAVAALFLGASCEKHSWEKTKRLHHHGDHDEHAEGEHGDHGGDEHGSDHGHSGETH